MTRPTILIPFMIAAIAAGCGSSATGGGGVVVEPAPRPTAAIVSANQISGLSGQSSAVNLSARTGTATLTGLISTDLTSGGQAGSRGIIGQSNLAVNFDSRAVTGSATSFAEVVSATLDGQITVTQWVQNMTGTLGQSGTLTHGAGGSGMTLTTSGNLSGSLVVNGQNVAGSYRIDAAGNGLSFQRKGATTYAVGGPGSGLSSDLEVTFAPTSGGAPIRVCMDNLCPTSGAGLGAVYVLQLQ